MTISATMHRVSGMSAGKSGALGWLEIRGESGSETFTVFMPLERAEAISKAFTECNAVDDAEEIYWTSREPDDRHTPDGLLRALQAVALK